MKRNCLTHEMEQQITAYCVQNKIEFNCATAYDAVCATYRYKPLTITEINPKTGEEIEKTITCNIARLVECQFRTIERIAAKIELEEKRVTEERYAENIKVAHSLSKPNLDKLITNLNRLNIIGKESYYAFVCFLMQLKHSRDNHVPENDKTCVFFNGVARNGKSATAKAICDVESQYGKVFKAQSGKILESTHEEQVWKSHLNYFDEVKPSDIDRELLLTIVNGGEVELNPKNKKQYNFNTNTNNIFKRSMFYIDVIRTINDIGIF